MIRRLQANIFAGNCKGTKKKQNSISNMSTNSKSVLVGMSGGIDSTAVCSMLLEEGYRVVGLTLVTCDSSLPVADDAAALTQRLGIEHHIADVREEFRSLVVQPFIDSYLAGYTPNPCVNCNPAMKFRLLCEWADRLGCGKIATGHYVKIETENGNHYIVTGDDSRKDQSYFLWRLTQEQLSRCLSRLASGTRVQCGSICKKWGIRCLPAEARVWRCALFPAITAISCARVCRV